MMPFRMRTSLVAVGVAACIAMLLSAQAPDASPSRTDASTSQLSFASTASVAITRGSARAGLRSILDAANPGAHAESGRPSSRSCAPDRCLRRDGRVPMPPHILPRRTSSSAHSIGRGRRIPIPAASAPCIG